MSPGCQTAHVKPQGPQPNRAAREWSQGREGKVEKCKPMGARAQLNQNQLAGCTMTDEN